MGGDKDFKFNRQFDRSKAFAPGAATWRSGRNIRVVFDFGLFPALYENIHYSGSVGHIEFTYLLTYLTVFRGEPTHGHR